MRASTIRVAGIAGVMILAATACGSSTSPATANKTLSVNTSFQVDNLDPGEASGTTSRLVIEQMYQPLFEVSGGAPTLNSGVAVSDTVSPDGLTYTIQLQRNVHFSDGTPMTSADVVFSLMRLKNLAAGNAFYMAGLTVTANGTYTVVVLSKTANPAIPADLSVQPAGIVNSKAVIAHGGSDALDASKVDHAESWLDQNSAGSGPYELVSSDPASQIVLGANPHYSGSKPAYTKIVMSNVPAQTQALDLTAESNPNVALDLSPSQAAGLSKSNTKVVISQSLDVFFVGLDVNPKVSSVSSNQDFRSAVRYALDYTTLLTFAGAGASQAPGLLAHAIAGSLSSAQDASQDLAKARQYLASSGLHSPTINLDYPSDLTAEGVSFADLAQVVQINLKAIGITVNLIPQPIVVWKANWKADKIPMMVYSVSGISFDPSNLFYYDPGGTFGKRMGFFSGMDPALDSDFAQIMSSPTNAQRVPIYEQAQVDLNSYAMFIPLFQGDLVIASSTNVGGLNQDGVGGVRFWELT